MKNPLVVAQKKELGMGDVTWEVDNGEFGSLKILEHGKSAPYWT